MTFFTIEQIKTANRNAGQHFFDKKTLRWWKSRICYKVFGCRFFVTSERMNHTTPRLYTVHEALPTGYVVTVGKFQEFSTLKQAESFAKQLSKA